MEVNVWVNNREKKVKGLTKRTTCHDVITALLYNKTKADQLSDDYIETYVLIEQWRECERILPRNTKIIKIWRSWHNEQHNVKFILRKKTKEFRADRDDNKTKTKIKEIPERSTRKRKQRGMVNSRRTRSVERSEQQEHIKWLNEQNNHRISRSNDELLESQSEQRPLTPSPPPVNPAPESEGLVELVQGQEEELHKLIENIRQTDLEIEYYETQMHLCRMHANGKDYVQESYLSATNAADNDELLLPPEQMTALSDTYPPVHIDTTSQSVYHHQQKHITDDHNSNVTNGPCFEKGKKRVTFAKLDSEGHKICASIESLNSVGIERKNGHKIQECTIYETNDYANDSYYNDNIKHRDNSVVPINHCGSLHRVNSSGGGRVPVKGILITKNDNTKQTMIKHDFNDTDSSSDTGLSSMQDSEDGGAVHTVSVTLV
ncbi:ras association domain-containing protein 9-like [Antedon mediterranea]|uniref:ras association domain-containing protein 9-like n=1 Tax=Antedon mediterranea TaxID=105859 RepID=UPI003AF9C980